MLNAHVTVCVYMYACVYIYNDNDNNIIHSFDKPHCENHVSVIDACATALLLRKTFKKKRV